MAAAVPQLTPLPNIEGPKLDPFTQNIDNHNFVIDEFLGTGVHSAVFRVAIDDVPYVVKFFKPEWTHEPCFDMFPLPEEFTMRGPIAANANPPQPPAIMDVLREQATSFKAECRVYGRLKELGKEHLAVRAHGYLKLFITPELQEQWEAGVKRKFPNDQYWQDECGSALKVLDIRADPSQPVYAIVKDYVPDHRNTGGHPTAEREMKQQQIKRIPQMLRDLHQLHKCGIVVRDLKEQQYYQGKIADFSHAWTVPHITAPENNFRPVWAWRSMAAWDLRCFQVFVINYWNNRAAAHRPALKLTSAVAWRNGYHEHNLRTRVADIVYLPLCKYDVRPNFEMKYDPPFDPSEFNWRGLERTKREKGIITGRVKKRTGRTGPRRKGGRRAAQANAGQANAGQANAGQAGGGQAGAGDADPGDVLM
ncbi:hypothetical protein NW768_010082 [Fusarium equiseti]|uniref:Uncharacterized protein n=1 Tax=Fusarium equiseti TaxID=61235 RepID=A0ABQ8R1G7_FUSEQ|nr:hypothetical protein NW768_010082 [Fusarium equiseti]